MTLKKTKQEKANDSIQAVPKQIYLSGQLESLVAIVISVIHLVASLSQDHPSHHHSQVDAFSPEVKLFHLQKDRVIRWSVPVKSLTFNSSADLQEHE